MNKYQYHKSRKYYEQFLDGSRDIGRIWKPINDVFDQYVAQLKVLHDAMGAYIGCVTDGVSLERMTTLKAAHENDMTEAITMNRLVFVDLPFLVLCCNADMGITSCKGIYDDDEEKMEMVMDQFSARTMGPEMLARIRSAYTSSVYLDLTKRLKDELGDKEYDRYLTRSKLAVFCEFGSTVFNSNTTSNGTVGK